MRIPAHFLAAAMALVGQAVSQCATFANTPPGTDLQLGDDDIRTVGLGFPFTFNNIVYDTISICSNGFVWLGSVGEDDFDGFAIDFFDNEADLLDFGPRIAVCWDDWNPSTGGNVFFSATAGSASVVWKGIPHFGALPGLLNAELVLTSTNEFFITFDASMIAPGSSCIVGTSAGGGGAANTLDWTTALPGNIPGCTGYELFLTGLFDLAGQTIQQIPTAPAAIDHLAQAGTLTSCPPSTYPPLASPTTAFGAGCPALAITNPSAMYELFTPTGGPNATDMTGLSIKFVKAGTNYVTAPGPGFDMSYTNQGNVVTQLDESIVPDLAVGPMGEFPFCNVAFAKVDAAANGYLVLQPGASSDFSPTAAEFLAEEARIAPHWTDYDLTFAGTFYWSNNDPNFCMATWVNAEMYSQPGTSNTFQCKLMANGDIIFSYGTVASAFDDVLVGIALANGAVDPGATDLSAAINNPALIDLGSMTLPLVHTVSGLASLNTNFSLFADNLSGGVLGAFVLGGTPLDIDLSGIGMTGCSTYCSIDEVFIVVPNGSRLQQTFFIPPAPILYGSTAHTQAAMFAAVNPFGVISSNRLTFTVGL